MLAKNPSPKKLLTSSSSSPAVLKGLIDKKILIQYEEEIGRISGFKGETKKLPELSSAQHTAFESVTTLLKRIKRCCYMALREVEKLKSIFTLLNNSKNKKKVLYLLPEIAITPKSYNVFNLILGIE